MILAETQTAAAILDAFIDAELARRGLAEDSLALVGFSQGTMMACMWRRGEAVPLPPWSAIPAGSSRRSYWRPR